MKTQKPIYLFRSPDGTVLSIAQDGLSYWRLSVNSQPGDVFEDAREAAKSAAGKLTGFVEWDEAALACPEELDEWQRI